MLSRIVAYYLSASPGSFSNAFFGSFQLDECEKWIRDQLACHDTRFSPGEFEDITDQLLQSSGTSTTNNFMGSPTDPTWSMVETNNLQHNMPSTEEKSTQVDVNQALNILSQHLANSDKLTTCDMICLSHLQDRVQSLTTDGSSSLNL